MLPKIVLLMTSPVTRHQVEPLNYLCHAWVSEERLLLGSECGRVQLFEGGDLRNEFNVSSVTGKDTSTAVSSKSSM